jgi:hypothetical protein
MNSPSYKVSLFSHGSRTDMYLPIYIDLFNDPNENRESAPETKPPDWMTKPYLESLKSRIGPYASELMMYNLQKGLLPKPQEEAKTTEPAEQPQKQQQYSLSMVAAISPTQILSAQIIQGTFDSTLLENFIYWTLKGIHNDSTLRKKRVMIFLDNARIHYHSNITETFKQFGAHAMFNAQYSPWLNPVERLFGTVKKKLQQTNTFTK